MRPVFLLSMLAVVVLTGLQVWRVRALGGASPAGTKPILFRLFVGLYAALLVVFATALALTLWDAIFTAPEVRMARSYPVAAMRAGVEGRAVLGCTLADGGRVKACRVVSEDPLGYGFGDAALKMAADIRLSQASSRLEPPGHRVRVPIRFKMPAPTAHASAGRAHAGPSPNRPSPAA